VGRASAVAAAEGTGRVVVRGAQPIACLASYLEGASRSAIMVTIAASTPTEAVVVPHGGLSRVFSCNPIAAGIPTDRDPILIDTTAAMSALGPLNRSYRLGQTLPAPLIVAQDGRVTDDPAEFVERGGGILPIGGTEQGYKGFSLALLTEALSGALGGFGRGSQTGDSEANGVFVQAIDPAHFAGRATFEQEMGRLAAQCRASAVAGGPDRGGFPGAPPRPQKGDRRKRGGGRVEPMVDDPRPGGVGRDCPSPEPI